MLKKIRPFVQLSALRARYVMLQPITNAQEVDACNAFAVVSPTNRVVVDQAKFRDHISRKIREQVEVRSMEEVS